LVAEALSIAGLGGVDGCVVLTDGLKVISFGSEIGVPEHDLNSSRYRHVNAVDGSPREDQSGESLGGTRHRSAFRLVRVVPGSTAVVVSQDGNITVIGNDGKAVTAWHATAF
jgi:hypothetical protein